MLRGKVIKRSEAVVDSTPVEGNLVKVVEPTALSIVSKPANQTGFKVVRSDEEENKEEKKPVKTILRRTRRAEQHSPVMKLTFPAGTSVEDAKTSVATYGMGEYRVEESDGCVVAIRADLKSISREDTQDIKLNDEGLVATVARNAPQVAAKSALTLQSLSFDASKYALEDVQRWVAEKCVDGTIEEQENSDQCYVVRRSELPEGEETRHLVLEDGITAVIVRSDAMSIPAGYVEVISEAAYGNWGWGQLDFSAAIADEEFSEAMRNALSRLDDVLRNIMIWSPLPLDVRKELVNRALAQFGEYVGTVMDSLPRQLLVSVVRSANPSTEKVMTTKDTTSGAATSDAKPEETKTAPAAETLTRADVEKIVADAVTAALAAKPAPEATKVERSEEPKKEEVKSISREDVTAVVSESLKPVMDAIAKLAGTTVVRSEGEANVSGKENEGQGKKADVFRGAFPGLRTAK